MITERLLGPDFIAFACWSLSCWIVGVGWAAYRALSWVDRMRSWADRSHEESRSFSGAPLVGAATHLEADQ